MRSTRSRMLVLLALAFVPTALGAGAADDLFRLVPPEAGAVLAIEDLRGHARTILDSTLARDLSGLPAVRAWSESPAHRQFQDSRREIESALGATLERTRDDVLGDAVVLSLHLAPGDSPEEARGLLLVRFRDRALLDRLIEAGNATERRAGNLADVGSRKHGSASYSVRNFRPETKPTEYYAILGETTFAWSNSEPLIRGAIDRSDPKANVPSLGGDPKFQKVREALPSNSVASLFVNPRLIERFMAALPAAPRKPEEERAIALFGRYLAAVDYAGAAIEWRDGPILHLHESIDPKKLDEPWRRWASRPGSPASLSRRVPPTALAVASLHVDLGAVHDLLQGLVPDGDRLKVEHFEELLSGLLLGKDFRGEVLPNLGPGVVASIDAPADAESKGEPPVLVAVEVHGDPSIEVALDNAVRTWLALLTLAPERVGDARIETIRDGGMRLTHLNGSGATFACAVGRGLMVIGNSPGAVAALDATGTRIVPNSPFERTRAAYFPKAESFAFVDLQRIRRVAEAHRPELARWFASRRDGSDESARLDLDQALALMGPFRAAFATSAIDPGFTSTHRTIGLIGREPTSKP